MSNDKVPFLQKASWIATCCQVVIVTISASLIWYQLEQQAKLSRAANTQALVNMMTPLNLKVTDPEMAELWAKGFEGIEKVPDERQRSIQREQYKSLLASNMIFYENVFSQYKANLLDPEIYEGWDRDLADFIQTHKLADYWAQRKHLYREDFRNHVDEIIAKQKSTTAK